MNMKLLSKTISYYLRHSPEEADLILTSAGWADTLELLDALEPKFPGVSVEHLHQLIVEEPNARFELSTGDDQIRAHYGHSVPVALPVASSSPSILYHGTSPEIADLVLSGEGLRPMSRTYVHLSDNTDLATRVGLRKSPSPVVLLVDAKALRADAGVVLMNPNDGQVWLADSVPAKYLARGPRVKV